MKFLPLVGFDCIKLSTFSLDWLLKFIIYKFQLSKHWKFPCYIWMFSYFAKIFWILTRLGDWEVQLVSWKPWLANAKFCNSWPEGQIITDEKCCKSCYWGVGWKNFEKGPNHLRAESIRFESLSFLKHKDSLATKQLPASVSYCSVL